MNLNEAVTIEDRFQARYKRMLKLSGKTRKQVAGYLGVTENTVNNRLNGHIAVSLKNADQMCGIFGMTLGQLLAIEI